MSYSIKWVKENLGITLKAIRYYEDEGLIPKNIKGKRREYNEDELNRLWSIKILIGIGYTAKEIRENIMNNLKFNFYESISEKIEELEKKSRDCQLYLNFAKTIKLTGRIPTTELGSMKFDDFIKYSRENWDFFSDETLIPGIEKIFLKEHQEMNKNDLEKISEQIESFGIENMYRALSIQAYLYIISGLKNLKPNHPLVELAVMTFYKYVSENHILLGFDRPMTISEFVKYFNPSSFEGDIGIMNERNFGKDGVLFISEALANFEMIMKKDNKEGGQ